jgi:hypothetical protein
MKRSSDMGAAEVCIIAMDGPHWPGLPAPIAS